MKKYYLQYDYGTGNNAGPKAKKDINRILATDNYQQIKVKFPKNKFYRLMQAPIIWKKSMVNIHDSIIVMQYPLYSDLYNKFLFKEIVKQKKNNNKFVVFIHDIETLRNTPDDEESIQKEINRLKVFDYVICHNDSMKLWLKSEGINVPMYSLKLFDYLSNSKKYSNNLSSNIINYAGNLNKALFLKQKFSNKKIYVYGPNKAVNFSSAEYKGQYSPEEIPLHINQGWGLVWDGDSITSPKGNMGNYLRYITPHKLSMYIRSGIPVIVWKQSAAYNFVKSNNIGIGIDLLTDVDTKLDDISISQYARMRANVLELAQKLNEGYFTKEALGKFEKYCIDEYAKK